MKKSRVHKIFIPKTLRSYLTAAVLRVNACLGSNSVSDRLAQNCRTRDFYSGEVRTKLKLTKLLRVSHANEIVSRKR